MLTRFVTKNLNLTEKDKEMLDKKLSKLSKFFPEEATLTVNLSGMKNDRRKVEVTVLYKETFYRGEVEDVDLISAVEKVVDIIEGQIRKNKTKLKKRLRDGAFDKFADAPADETKPEISRVKTFSAAAMDVSEAIVEMDLLSHDFFIFKNAETGEPNVVYKRKDGRYGLLVPKF